MRHSVMILAVLLSMVASSVLAADKQNLLENGGFETPVLEGVNTSLLDPAEWMVYAGPGNKKIKEKIGLSANVKRSGKQSMFVRSVGIPGGFQGIWLNVPVLERKKYEFELYVLNNEEMPMHGNIRGEMSIEWKDVTGKEISRSIGPAWTKSNSKKSWKRYRIRERAPANAVQARLVVTTHEGASADDQSSYFIDDIVFRQR